jgi:hypothetical protein
MALSLSNSKRRLKLSAERINIQIGAQQYAPTLGRQRINRFESRDGTSGSGRGGARYAAP